MQIINRSVSPRTVWSLEQAGIHPLLARLFAGRGIQSAEQLNDGLNGLHPPDALTGATAAATLIADALEQNKVICIVADYDCDGATACAVAIKGLRMLGAASTHVHYVVPDRAIHGYGLTPAIVDLALQQQPDLLITVDNGIASLEGIAYARQHGLQVIVTDHHLPALDQQGQVVLPPAHVIVNPNQPGCQFESKSLAGVGVMFYVLLALRAELRTRQHFTLANQPRLDSLLDLVALGTIADVVKLDANNRRLVAQGLKRIRSGKMQAGLAALFQVAKRDATQANTFDFGFALGPRINAAGRLAEMTLGIECLITDDHQQAAELAQTLDQINRERRGVEAGMLEQAEVFLAQAQTHLDSLSSATPAALALFDESFNEGVVGIVASRIKDRFHRPVFVFARGQDGTLKGSGRSIPGFHLRDALDLISKHQPTLLKKFGGHAMAAGCTLDAAGFEPFKTAFKQVAESWLEPQHLAKQILTDGSLDAEWFQADCIKILEQEVWGQAFEAPLFSDQVDIISQRLVGEKHLKLQVRHQSFLRDAIWFGHTDNLPGRVTLAYRLALDEYQGRQRVQMVIEAASAS